MSYSLSLYAVDLARVREAVGSGDQKLRRMVGGRFKGDMARDDDWFSYEIRNGAPTRYEALRAVIDGGPFEEAHAFQYAYAYQMLCRFHGRPLDNGSFSPFRGRWLDAVDEGLASLGVKAVSVAEFGSGSPPPPLPRPDDLPGYGEWSAEQCREGLAQWEAATPEQRAALDPEVLRAAESCAGWLRQVAQREDCGIAGFHF